MFLHIHIASDIKSEFEGTMIFNDILWIGVRDFARILMTGKTPLDSVSAIVISLFPQCSYIEILVTIPKIIFIKHH